MAEPVTAPNSHGLRAPSEWKIYSPVAVGEFIPLDLRNPVFNIRSVCNYRKRLVLIADTERIEVATEWDDQDNLHCATPHGDVAVADCGSNTVERLLSKVQSAGYGSECCWSCRYFWISGLGADCASTLGNCMQGKLRLPFTGDDYVHMTGICDAFHAGVFKEQQAIYDALIAAKNDP